MISGSYQSLGYNTQGVIVIPKNDGIICPHCNKLVENDDYIYPVSYWGSENGFGDFDCPHCEKTFQVEEVVDRYYIVKKGAVE